MLITLDLLLKSKLDPFDNVENQRFDYHLLQFHKHYKEQSIQKTLVEEKNSEKELILT